MADAGEVIIWIVNVLLISVTYFGPMFAMYKEWQSENCGDQLKTRLPELFYKDGCLIIIRKVLTALVFMLWPVWLVLGLAACLVYAVALGLRWVGRGCALFFSISGAESCCGVKLGRGDSTEDDVLPLHESGIGGTNVEENHHPAHEETLGRPKWHMSTESPFADTDSCSTITAPPAYPGST